jgi:hypothetical protein
MGGEGEEPPPPLLNWTSGRWRRDLELKAVVAVAGDASEQERVEVCVCLGERAYRDCWSTGAAGSGALSSESRAGGVGGGVGGGGGWVGLRGRRRRGEIQRFVAAVTSERGRECRKETREDDRRSVTHLEASTHKRTREHFEPTINDRTVKKNSADVNRLFGRVFLLL